MRRPKYSILITSDKRFDYDPRATYALEREFAATGEKDVYYGITFRSRTMRDGTVRTYGYQPGELKK